LATEAVSTGAENDILKTGFTLTLKKLLGLAGMLSSIFIEEIKKLPGGGGGTVSLFLAQLTNKKLKNIRR
jgi:hypothetical protein